MLELVEQGNPSPTAEATAECAGVSLRTVFRHFEDMDSLHAAMIAIVFDRLRPILERPLQCTSWPDTLDEAIDRRAQFFETLIPFKTAMEVLQHRSRPVRIIHRRMDTISRNLLTAAVPPELLAERQTFELLVLLLSAESWHRLRFLQRMGVAEATAALRAGARLVTGLSPDALAMPARTELSEAIPSPN